MTKPTGNPPGRPRGAKNRRTREVEAAAVAAAAKIGLAVPGAFEGDAHAFLMSVYKDPSQPVELRLEAAGKAIRYEKPALASVENKGEIRWTVSAEPLTEEEWEAKHCVDRGTGSPH